MTRSVETILAAVERLRLSSWRSTTLRDRPEFVRAPGLAKRQPHWMTTELWDFGTELWDFGTAVDSPPPPNRPSGPWDHGR